MDGALRHVSDQDKFIGITYHYWGLLLFFTASAMALWPLAKTCYYKWRDREAESPGTELVWITAALIPSIFFYFNTQMHERYIHPALFHADGTQPYREALVVGAGLVLRRLFA